MECKSWPLEHEKDAGNISPSLVKVVTLRPISPDDLDKEVEAVFKRGQVSTPDLWIGSFQNSTPVSQFGPIPALFNGEDVFGAFTADEQNGDQSLDFKTTSIYKKPCSPEVFNSRFEVPNEHNNAYFRSVPHVNTTTIQSRGPPPPIPPRRQLDGDTCGVQQDCNTSLRAIHHEGNVYTTTIQSRGPPPPIPPRRQLDGDTCRVQQDGYTSFRPIQPNYNAQSSIQALVRPIPVLGQPGGNTLRAGMPNINHASFRPIQGDFNAHSSIIPAYALAHPSPVRQEPPQADQAETKASLEEALLKATQEPNMNDAPCNSEKAEPNNLVNT